MSHCHTITMRLCYSASMPYYHIATLSDCHSVRLSYCHTVTLRHYHTVTLLYYQIVRFSRMRIAKGFFAPFLVAEWLHYCRRPPTGVIEAKFAESLGDIDCSSSKTSISNSRMRLAKGFFLSSCRGMASLLPPSANRRPSEQSSRSLLVI